MPPSSLLHNQKTLEPIALRLVWFQDGEATLNQPRLFFAHLFTYGTPDDIRAVQNLLGDTALRDALRNAPPGIIDARSWHYWHHRLGMLPVPPMPVRKLD